MIPLPPGCTVGYEIRFMVEDLDDDIGQWFNMIGGKATLIEYWDAKGRRKTTKQVQYGKAKPSYKTQDGTNNTIVRFNGTDASTASVFLLKFLDKIKQHNLKDYHDH